MNNNLIEDIIKNTNEPTTEEMDTFKNLVTDWFKYDDAIRKLNIAIRERKTLQNVLNNSNLTGEQLLAKIFNKYERPIIEKKSIRRIIPKVSMSLDI